MIAKESSTFTDSSDSQFEVINFGQLLNCLRTEGSSGCFDKSILVQDRGSRESNKEMLYRLILRHLRLKITLESPCITCYA